MRYSRALIPTLKEAPSDATTVSHILLWRAGFIRPVGAGIYSFLPLGVRVLRKVERIIREEIDRAGGQELLLPALLPAEFFRETGRWDLYGDTLMRLKDRKGGDYHLGPTHEEIITDLARREIRSYRDLPTTLYQVQTKFRDEPRPRAGLLRCREFLMKDAYSFDVDAEAALKSYEIMRGAYSKIFDRMGFDFRIVAANSGAIGGDTSAEFQILVQSGEDVIAACTECEYAANVEVASTPAPEPHDSSPLSGVYKEVHTPGHGTIAEVSAFLKTTPASFLKSLLYTVGAETVMVVVRGDHDVNEVKLANALGVDEVFLASEADVRKATGANVGFAGPVGFSGKILIDAFAAAIDEGVCGANKTDYHVTGIQYGRNFSGDLCDLRSVVDGDPCEKCGAPLKLYRGIEGGHIFVLGTKYSETMGATYLDEAGKAKAIVMGCYGIGVSRLVASAVEQHNDDNGIVWPMAIAPFHVHIAQLGEEPEVIEAVAKLESELEAKGIEVLVDDRAVRPGVKFKDADLIGVPLRVTVGARALAQGGVELKARTETNPKNAELVPLAEATDRIIADVGRELGA